MDVLRACLPPRALRISLIIFLVLGGARTSFAVEILAKVNTVHITDRDLELEILSRSFDPDELSEAERAKVLEDLIDRELVKQHLDELRVRSDRIQIAAQIKLLKEKIEAAEKEPEETLEALGLSDVELQKRLRWASMWQNYFNQLIGEKELQQYFEKNRQKFDGTEFRASQIFLKLPTNATEQQIAEAKSKLAAYKQQIESGQLNFAEAAQKWSEAPSADRGGDLGFAPYGINRLKLFSEQLLPLEVGEITEPFKSPFGVHLLMLTKKRPGAFEFVDVRPIVLQSLKAELWETLVNEKRKTGRIQYTKSAPGR
ncbi:MAG: peptidylprolyl isomerase [Planctomycetaceae bacterium]|nr:peptidylprolyl isomerase [Planctomycetaceae bacterium]